MAYPYEHLDMPSPMIMFENLKSHVHQVSTEKYILQGNRHHDPLYQKGYVSITSAESDIFTKDGISDHFNEVVRLSGSVKKHSSPLDWWRMNGHLYEEMSTQKKRDIIWQNNKWPTRFRPSWVRTIIQILYPDESYVGKTMLDFSAGWGDRLIGAISLGMKYLGYDPNVRLADGHTDMIYTFGDPDEHQIIYKPFETSILPNKKFDIVFTSPPFFNLESYNNDKTQSTVRYPNFNDWVDMFLLRSIKKAWNALTKGGYFIIHLSDSPQYPSVERMKEHMLAFPDSQYEGVIGVSGEKTNKYNPIWIWKKN